MQLLSCTEEVARHTTPVSGIGVGKPAGTGELGAQPAMQCRRGDSSAPASAGTASTGKDIEGVERGVQVLWGAQPRIDCVGH